MLGDSERVVVASVSVGDLAPATKLQERVATAPTSPPTLPRSPPHRPSLATPLQSVGLLPYQRLNHFPGTWELGRKDKLYRNIAKFRRLRGADFDFVPRFFVLPDDWDSFRNHVSRHPNAMYIR